MSGTLVILVVNIAVASLFAASFAVVATINKSQRGAYAFSAAYLTGMLTPVAELLAWATGWRALIAPITYATFLTALLGMSAAIAAYHGRRPPWRGILLILILGLSTRALLLVGAPGTLGHELLFQAPLAAAAGLACWTTLRTAPMKPLTVALAATCAAVAALFPAKAFMAVALGSGSSDPGYLRSSYALLSQAGTGILLLCAGLIILLIVVQRAISDVHKVSETDPLSGVANRRGFDRLAGEAVANARRERTPVSLAVFDLDRFKSVNDTYGHDTGDRVIAAFAHRLGQTVSASAVIGRTGGEEFVMLLGNASADVAWLQAEAVRSSLADQPLVAGLPPVHVSAGVAELFEGDTLGQALRRADQAALEAKRSGRNRVVKDERVGPDPAAANVIPLKGYRRSGTASTSAVPVLTRN